MREIEFTKNFANKKKGDKGRYSPDLAHRLVKIDKVAKYTDVKPKKTKAKK